MAKKPRAPRAKPISLAPLSLEQALGAALRVKPQDVAKLENANKKKPARKKRA
jgi:hypothetical protein